MRAIFVLAAANSGCNSESIQPLVKERARLAPPRSITYRVRDYCASSGATLAGAILTNASYSWVGGEIRLDTDRDGVADAFDSNSWIGLSPASAESNSNGLGDLALYSTGLSTSSQARLLSFSPCDSLVSDTDGDGLTDCTEKALLKTNDLQADTDGDSIPDELELRFGLNPLDSADAALDPGGEGISNLEKSRLQLPVRETVSADLRGFGHSYRLNPHLGSTCFDLTVENVPVVNVAGGNLILLHFQEKSLNAEDSALARQLRCCSVVPSGVADQNVVSVLWEKSPELICPCPVGLDLKG